MTYVLRTRFVTTQSFSLRNNLVNRAVGMLEVIPRTIIFFWRGFKFKFEFIIDSISYKTHFLLLKL